MRKKIVIAGLILVLLCLTWAWLIGTKTVVPNIFILIGIIFACISVSYGSYGTNKSKYNSYASIFFMVLGAVWLLSKIIP